MRQVLPFVVVLALSATALADVEISREEAATIKSYDLSQAEDKGPELNGQLVKLKFNYRSKAVEKANDGSLSGSIRLWRTSTATRSYKYGSMSVQVPKDGADWFMRVSPEESRASIVVFARLTTSKYGDVVAQLLGREIKTDLKGSKIVW